MAKAVLEGKKQLHELVGRGAEWIARLAGASWLEGRIVKELAERIHIPGVDERAIFVARALQIVGILLGLSRDIPLDRCQSFIDLSLAETKERVKEILVAAMRDWSRPSDSVIIAWGARAAARP